MSIKVVALGAVLIIALFIVRRSWVRFRNPIGVALGKIGPTIIHYEMRGIADKFPSIRSERGFRLIEGFAQTRPLQYRAVLVYQGLWLQHCYPGPSMEVCASNRAAGRKRRFVSIGAVISRPEWAEEVEGAFLRANSLEDMRVVAMNYPVLLRPAVQGGIDSQIEHGFPGPERTTYFAKVRYLQQLREEVERRPVQSWWREK